LATRAGYRPDFVRAESAILRCIDPLTWLSEPSAQALQAALRQVAPGVVGPGVQIELGSLVGRSREEWASTAAFLGDALVVKFAWSGTAAGRLQHECVILEALQSDRQRLRIPEIVTISSDPVLLITRRAPGAPLTWEFVGRAGTVGTEQLGSELATFLSVLHQPEVVDRVRDVVGAVETPAPQATTAEIRQRLLRWIRPDQHELVATWCDWVDHVLEPVAEHLVFVHGDLHGHNELWDLERFTLGTVVDFETAGPGEPEFDFRYLPAQGPTVDLCLATMSAYETITGHAISLNRTMAWHIRTVLGDALWRSEASVPLPGDGHPAGWVDELAQRMTDLGIHL
jgi:aminoglycoside phosphotransferase (APT) family kinase protein